jgi:hypothetical protein
MYAAVNSTSESVVISMKIQYALCCPAHILQYMWFSLCNSCSYFILPVFHGYRHWKNVKLIFHKTSQKKIKVGGGIIRYGDAAAPEVDPPKSTAANKPAFQECCHLTVDVLWCLVMLKNNIWFLISCDRAS